MAYPLRTILANARLGPTFLKITLISSVLKILPDYERLKYVIAKSDYFPNRVAIHFNFDEDLFCCQF